ncbi:MAG: acyl-CoA thioesterase [Burkholderiales bacterium]
MPSSAPEKWFDLSRTIVMPAHCDVYGHMNVRHYAACFDDAGWHIPRMAGFSLEEFRARGLGTVVATLSIDFHHEIRAGQLILVRGAVTRVGTKSFRHEMRLYEADSMTHCATQKTVEVCFDTAARQGVAFPQDIREKLAAITPLSQAS